MKRLTLPIIAMLCAATLLTLSCRRQDRIRTAAALDAADSLMDHDPHAALDTLLRIRDREDFRPGKSGRAMYALLLTEARYKCYEPVARDSAIFDAARYYRKHGDRCLYARALVMQGAVLFEQGDAVAALESYKKAEPLFADSGDLEQLGLLHTRIGELYQMSFSNIPNAVFRYRSAADCFDRSQATKRLPVAYLTLSRMLLPMPDSTEQWKESFRKGDSLAAALNDSASMVNAREQLAYFLLLHDKDYSHATRTAVKTLREFDRWIDLITLQNLTSVACQSYIKLGLSDSAEALAGTFPVHDDISRMMKHDIAALIAADRQDWKQAYDNIRASKDIKDSINTARDNTHLDYAEDSFEIQYYKLLNDYQKQMYLLVILAITTCLAILGLTVQRITSKLRSLRTEIKKSGRFARRITGDETGSNDEDISGDLTLIATCLDRLQSQNDAGNRYAESNMRLTETSKVLLNFIDETLNAYYTYENCTTFRNKISECIERHFPKNNIKNTVTGIASSMYPGFLEHLEEQYGINNTDKFYIALILCGFRGNSQQVLARMKNQSISVSRSRTAAKLGQGMMLSKSILKILTSISPTRP